MSSRLIRRQKRLTQHFRKYLVCSALLLATAYPAIAKNSTFTAVPPGIPTKAPGMLFRSLTVEQGSGTIITLKQPVFSLFSADPSVLEVHPSSPTSIFVFGKAVGETTLAATDANGHLIVSYRISVTPSHYLSDRISTTSKYLAPQGTISAQTDSGGIMVRGIVNTPEEANNVINQAKLISPTGSVVNDLQVREPIQVQLKVRIAYMSRDITRQLGVNWNSVTSTGFSVGKFIVSGGTSTLSPSISGTQPGSLGVAFPGGTFEGVIDALATDNLAHIVAEPTLTTLSGTQASFLVGGQFPIPVAEQNGTISIEFKNYGVQLIFTPTVFSDGRISLQVSPTLSQISSANSVTETTIGSSSAIVVPSLLVQQASSSVILGSGEGMAMAGLLEDQSDDTTNAVPGLGEIPIIGALFRGNSMQREQQELVITVTPYLVNPVSNPGLFAQPDDGWTPPNDLQRILMLEDNGTHTASLTIPGDSGFMMQ